MKYFKKIIVERIYLSPMCIDDLELFVKWMNDSSVTDGLGDSGMQYNMLSEKEWVEDNLKNGKHQYSIILLENDELIGNIGIDDLDEKNKRCTLGLFIGEDKNRNKGYGTEALKLLIGYAFDVLNFNNVMLNVFSFNERAIAAYKKVGFKEFGRRRQAYYLKNKYHDVVYMDIIREDWYK